VRSDVFRLRQVRSRTGKVTSTSCQVGTCQDEASIGQRNVRSGQIMSRSVQVKSG